MCEILHVTETGERDRTKYVAVVRCAGSGNILFAYRCVREIVLYFKVHDIFITIISYSEFKR